MVYHSDNKSPQVSRTLLSILADLNNAVVWMVFTFPLISKSSSPCINPLVTVLRTPITVVITVSFMFLRFFFQFSRQVPVLIHLFDFFQFYSMVSPDSKVHNSEDSLLLLLTIIRSGRQVEIKGSVCISKSHRSLGISFSRTDSGLCICSLGHISTSCTIPIGSSCPPSRVYIS